MERYWTPDNNNYIQGFSGPLSQKSDENPRMRVIPHSKFPPKCAHAPILVAFFVTTDLKNPVDATTDHITPCSRMRARGNYASGNFINRVLFGLHVEEIWLGLDGATRHRAGGPPITKKVLSAC